MPRSSFSVHVAHSIGQPMPSDPDDPHEWKAEFGEDLDARSGTMFVQVVWRCAGCNTMILVRSSVTADVGLDEVVRRVRASAEELGSHVIPACSVMRLARDVMES